MSRPKKENARTRRAELKQSLRAKVESALNGRGPVESSPRDDSFSDEDFFVNSLKGVTRLDVEATKIVPHSPSPRGSSVRTRARAREFEMVVEADDDLVVGYRRDLGRTIIERVFRRPWVPQATVDLHGQRVRALVGVLNRELAALTERRITRVLVIHGKGLHSAGPGVLRSAVIDVLASARAAGAVRAFRTAPLHLGGTGALVVQLAARSTARRHRDAR